jgi:hypothetical protein
LKLGTKERHAEATIDIAGPLSDNCGIGIVRRKMICACHSSAYGALLLFYFSSMVTAPHGALHRCVVLLCDGVLIVGAGLAIQLLFRC